MLTMLTMLTMLLEGGVSIKKTNWHNPCWLTWEAGHANGVTGRCLQHTKEPQEMK